ncbi:MAG: lipopolysaccharide transport system permease protein [Acidobacteriota bacterium]|jgi:lipopolysaccharide transport system permease protein|nr:lipopolysaccharide transport system permease protein [Acidobacteriota bacterium]
MTTSNSAGTLDQVAEPAADEAVRETAAAAGVPPPDAAAAHVLPDEPLVVIEPRKSSLDLRGMWVYRELLYFLMWRDVKVRYKQTLLGVLWVVLQPLLMMLLFTLFFGRLAGIKSDGVPYSLFAYAGLLPWTFFATAATASGNSMVNSASLITKVYFPRVLVPAAAVGAVLVDLAISFGVLVLLMIYWRITPTWNLLMLLPVVVLLTVLAMGFGLLASGLNVKYRDVRLALPFLIQVWFFASPIIYPTEMIPERWRWLLHLNPMTGIVEGFRSALYGRKPFDWSSLATSVAVTLALLAVAAFTFRRMEKGFADTV